MSIEKVTSAEKANQLQFLRFLAFGFIFLFHADIWSFSFFPHGSGAASSVSFFIILSGIVSGYSSFNKSIDCSLKNIMSYIYKKIRKVYPLYVVTTIFSISYSGLPICIAEHNFSDAIPLLKQLLKSLLLIQSWFPENYFSYNGVGWFLSTIMFLYIINLPLLYVAEKIRRSKHNILFFFISFMGIGSITVIYCFLMRNTNMEFWEYIFPPSRMGEYMMGICLANLVRLTLNKIDFNNFVKRVIFTILEIGAISLWIYAMYRPMEAWEFRIVHWLLPNIVLLLIFTMGNGYISSVFQLNPLKHLGDISFECFLLHQIIIHEYSINSGVETTGRLGKVFSISICLLITILIAELIHKKQIDDSKSD